MPLCPRSRWLQAGSLEKKSVKLIASITRRQVRAETLTKITSRVGSDGARYEAPNNGSIACAHGVVSLQENPQLHVSDNTYP